ncbi:hypothetical protein Y1Q_0009205 [Alligator mississippiensis]|uniref:Uncharacterized protein n=1 Tax=Alligator mississippiensis TaxID=8496 RepID=A0A151M2P3_ALLMI|nr:hypothetical protein Y1Q_0009205 [Alligator mississippiensis]
MAWRLEHKQIQDFAKEYVGATTGVAGMAALSYSQSPHLTGVGKTVPQKQQLGTFKVPQAALPVFPHNHGLPCSGEMKQDLSPPPPRKTASIQGMAPSRVEAAVLHSNVNFFTRRK